MKGIILDTNVISETRRAQPHPTVVAWFASQRPERLFLTATVVGELAVGIACLPAGRRRWEMAAWLKAVTDQHFAGRMLPYDAAAGLLYGEIVAHARAQRRTPNISDAQIAAVAQVNEMAVATRDVSDFEPLAAATINRWQAT